MEDDTSEFLSHWGLILGPYQTATTWVAGKKIDERRGWSNLSCSGHASSPYAAPTSLYHYAFIPATNAVAGCLPSAAKFCRRGFERVLRDDRGLCDLL